VPPNERPPPVSVECKKYSTVGGQAEGYREFLAVAYANTAHVIHRAAEHALAERAGPVHDEMPSRVSESPRCARSTTGVAAGDRVDAVMLPVRDGVTVARRC
jgi:hypothetical protein